MNNKNALNICLALISIAVLYFSWLPDPNIGFQPYFPLGIGRWINENWNVRTAIPFVFLAALAEIGFVQGVAATSRRFVVIACLLLLVTMAEVGQLFLSNRHFDPGDILWGFLGSIAGLIAGYLIKPVFKNKEY